jgi:hypothetical protein
MKINYLLIFINIFAFALEGSDDNVQNILLKSFHRLDNINHQFLVKFKESGKKVKIKNYKILVHWPNTGEHLKETRIMPVMDTKNKPSSFWEYQFKDKRKSKRWMSMPITGNLKDVSDKKPSKKFSLADLEFSKKDIFSNENSFIGSDTLNGSLNYIINSITKTKNGKANTSKKVWIGTENYVINKVEFYTKSGRLFRIVECQNVDIINGFVFPSKVYVQDIKSKTEFLIDLYEIEINPSFSKQYFIPIDQ